MKIELKQIKVRDIVSGYTNNEEEGVTGFNGSLNIRPPYQREFVYKDKQQKAVISTIVRGFPLNTMYWVKNEDDSFELLDGQQRTMSICEFVEGNFSMEFIPGVQQCFHNLPDSMQEKILDYEYTLTFNEKEHQVNIHICKDGDRYIPDAGNNVVGIDVNCKHNLFSLSDGTTFDYNRKLVNDFCKLSLEIDELKQDKNYTVGKRKQRKLDSLKNKMIKSEQQIIAEMCNELRTQGVNHIVMEDLDNSFGKSHVKDTENENVNYNRKVKFIGLSSLKQEVEHIARKYDIAVSTVQASYTSKMCPVCGCIEDENRPNQETFECVECGHKDNADFNASVNIRNRVTVTVLRDLLLKQLGNGAYEPRKLQRDKVKEVLLSFRRNLQESVGSECAEGGSTIFEYV